MRKLRLGFNLLHFHTFFFLRFRCRLWTSPIHFSASRSTLYRHSVNASIFWISQPSACVALQRFGILHASCAITAKVNKFYLIDADVIWTCFDFFKLNFYLIVFTFHTLVHSWNCKKSCSQNEYVVFLLIRQKSLCFVWYVAVKTMYEQVENGFFHYTWPYVDYSIANKT